MVSQEQLKCLKILVLTEQKIIKEYKKLIEVISEPQLKSEFQNIVCFHRNHLERIKNALENLYEK